MNIFEEEKRWNSGVVLVVSATEAECAPTIHKMAICRSIGKYVYSGILREKPVDVLIGGIGAAVTTFRLTQVLMQQNYRYVVSIGIAGSFVEEISVGDVVEITEDCFADLGIDDRGSFRTLYEMGITAPNDDPTGDFMSNPSPTLSPYTPVRGITVQTASGSSQRINQLVDRFHPHVETMENAAFFYVCHSLKVPFASFRGISNRVEPRNRSNWCIGEAIDHVNEALEYIFDF